MDLTLVGLLYIAVLILLANAATALGIAHRYLRLLQTALPAVIAIQLLGRVARVGAQDLHQWLYLGFATASIVFMLLLIGFKSPWRLVERVISVASPGGSSRFDSRQPVHRLALLLLIFALALLYWTASAEDGPQALFAAYATTEGALLNLFTDTTVYILLALLGVGWLVRRDWRQTVQRLGLRFPTGMDMLAGIALGCVLYLAVALFTLLWQSMASASSFASQTAAARQIFDSFSSSLFSGALLALLAALGEEILFRGALQPVFGIVIVSLFFTAIHLQYAFSPAAVIVFAVALAFGLLRACLSATAAIIAHFVYNMIPFLFASLA